ncbi:hypothetical protein HQ314_05555 [Rhodococcus sp. BP-332]|uniref:hypothetical protein n=1 Tax=Rhodococcus sp. BP-332 TaxID=2739447 RepID=UPI001C9AF81B|nr:hypothetical protein [Rhodococcus sp. BP-332]MBY6676378.1 hypothetical protein [Rhodococcus sp. BP-332]
MSSAPSNPEPPSPPANPVENLGDSGAGKDAPFTVSLDLADGELGPGTSIAVTLTFEEAGDVTVDAPFDVTEPGTLDAHCLLR